MFWPLPARLAGPPDKGDLMIDAKGRGPVKDDANAITSAVAE
jgi:hypothetical protein